jgi:hypothetical protein
MGVAKRIWEARHLGGPRLRAKATQAARVLGADGAPPPGGPPPAIDRVGPWDFGRTWPAPLDFPDASPAIVAAELRWQLGTARGLWASAGHCEAAGSVRIELGMEFPRGIPGTKRIDPGMHGFRAEAKRLRVRFYAVVEDVAERFGRRPSPGPPGAR